MKHGGKLFQLNDTDNSSCFVCRDMYNVCLENQIAMKQIVAEGKFQFENDIVAILFDNMFLIHLNNSLTKYNKFCSLITKFEAFTTTIADAAEEWLKIKDYFEGEIREQIHKILTPVLLTANFLHPVYKGKLFEKNSEWNTLVFDYLIEMLDQQALIDYYDFINKEGLFKTLLAKEIESSEKFWSFAKMRYPALAKFAHRLIHIPASMFLTKFQPVCQSNLKAENYKKRVEIYHKLKLEDKNISEKY